jgi:hypothetical protein
MTILAVILIALALAHISWPLAVAAMVIVTTPYPRKGRDHA